MVAIAASVWMLHFFRPVLWPFLLALVVVILLRAPLRLRNRALRWLVFSLLGATSLGLAVAAALIVPAKLGEAAASAPSILARLDGLLLDLSTRLNLDDPLTLNQLVGPADLRAGVGVVFAALRDAAAGLVLGALFVVLLLVCWRQIEHRAGLLSKREGFTSASGVVHRAMRGVEDYFWIQTITGLANAGAGALVMAAVGLEHWPAWAITLFVLGYAPFIGVAVGSIAPALAALMQFPGVWPALCIFLVIQVVAFLVGNLLAPKLQADRQNLDPSTGLLAVGAWTLLWGAPGAFLAVPITIALMHVLAASPGLQWLAVLISHDGAPGGAMATGKAVKD